jgi:hypothetical protein
MSLAKVAALIRSKELALFIATVAVTLSDTNFLV